MDTIDTDTYLMKLPDPLKDQLKWLYTQCHDDPKINRLKYKIHEKYGGSKEAAGFIAMIPLMRSRFIENSPLGGVPYHGSPINSSSGRLPYW